ncbi:type I toxin-antitoxin system Fst family toxin [Levilactobacillus brevis]
MFTSFFAPLAVGLLVALFTDWLDRRHHIKRHRQHLTHPFSYIDV